MFIFSFKHLLVDNWSNHTEYLVGLEGKPAHSEEADHEHEHFDGLKQKYPWE